MSIVSLYQLPLWRGLPSVVVLANRLILKEL